MITQREALAELTRLNQELGLYEKTDGVVLSRKMTYPYVCGGCGLNARLSMNDMTDHWRGCK